MKKLMFIIMSMIFSSIVMISCNDEDVKPTTNSTTSGGIGYTGKMK